MTIFELGALGELIGAIAVVFTLIYLAMQIRENSRQMKVGSAVALNHLINEGFDPIYNSEETMHIWLTGLNSPSSLDDKQWSVFGMFMARILNTLETAIVTNENDVMDKITLEQFVHTMRTFLETPGGKRWSEDTGFYMISSKLKSLLNITSPPLDGTMLPGH